MAKRLSKKFWEEVKKDFEAGMTQAELRKKYNLGAGTLGNKIKRDGWKQIRKISENKKNIYKKLDKPFNKKSGFIYIISFEDTNKEKFYKIGKENNPKQRISAIQTSNPFQIKIELCFYVCNVEEIENKLHTIFSENRLKGEWFELDYNKIQKIKEIIVFGGV